MSIYCLQSYKVHFVNLGVIAGTRGVTPGWCNLILGDFFFTSSVDRWHIKLHFNEEMKWFNNFFRKWEHRSSLFLSWFGSFPSVILVVRARNNFYLINIRRMRSLRVHLRVRCVNCFIMPIIRSMCIYNYSAIITLIHSIRLRQLCHV